MKKTILILILFLLSIITVLAQESHDIEIEEGKELVESKISCDKLSNEQLEAMGDYYMEQMHPGEAHEIMDNMMGGEGSESLKQVHIQMAKRLYCNEDINVMMDGGMMNMMNGSFSGSSWWLWGIVAMLFWIALFVALILLIIWLYKKVTGQTTNDDSALEILKRKFVKGEMTKKEFDDMKKEIEQ